ncbi:hypothetical protein ACLQ26_32800 [Micromonospora sp. DT43]
MDDNTEAPPGRWLGLSAVLATLGTIFFAVVGSVGRLTKSS